MATSQEMNTDNRYIKYQITVTQNSQDITANTSNVTVSVRFYRTNTGYVTQGNGTVYCHIDGTTYTQAVVVSQAITNAGIVLFSIDLNIPHNADGQKTLVTSAWIDHSQFSSTEQAYSQALTTIPRTSKPTVTPGAVTMGGVLTIQTNRASTSFTHTLTYSFGGAAGTIASGVGASHAWMVPVDLAAQIPGATTGTGSITCITYSGSAEIGRASVSFAAAVPGTVVPVISNVALSEATDGVAEKFGAFIQGRSRVRVSITASGAYGSSITGYRSAINGSTLTGQQVTTTALKSSGNQAAAVTVTDSRGRTATTNKMFSVLPYTGAQATAITAFRCGADGTQDATGEYARVDCRAGITALGNLNDKAFTLRYRALEDGNWTEIDLTGESYMLEDSRIIGGMNADQAYTFELIATDYFGSSSRHTSLPTAFVLLSADGAGQGVALGAVARPGRVSLGLPTDLWDDGAWKHIGAVGNANLLQNGYFLNPVNQRGQTSYAASGRTVDRWHAGVDVRVNLSADGMTLTNSATASRVFFQYIEFPERMWGRTFTLSIEEADGTIYTVTTTLPTTPPGGSQDFNTSTTPGGYICLRYNPARGLCAAYWVKAGGSVTLRRAKLEPGGVSTLQNDFAPDYGQELIRCQRYFQRLTNLGNTAYFGYTESSTLAVYVPLNLPVTLRANPTVTMSDTTVFLMSQNAASGIAVNATNTVRNGTGQVYVGFTPAAAVQIYSLYKLRIANGGYVDLDSDI